MQHVENIKLTTSAAGTVVPVKAVPGSSRDRVWGVYGERLKVAVSAAAEKGKANKAIAAVLAKALGIAPRDVRLASGATNPQKEFAVSGLNIQQVREKLSGL